MTPPVSCYFLFYFNPFFMTIIFYADDDFDDQEIFITVLNEIIGNAQIILLNDGTELSRNLNDKVPPVPDFLFLDLNMPLKSGHECLREIRANPFFNSMKVIILSTSRSSNEIDLTYKNGADHYICKSSDMEDCKSKTPKEDYLIV